MVVSIERSFDSHGIGKPGSVEVISAWAIWGEFHRRWLPDGGVCIEDRYRIGSAVFEVMQR
jgi:hypothetical protein